MSAARARRRFGLCSHFNSAHAVDRKWTDPRLTSSIHRHPGPNPAIHTVNLVKNQSIPPPKTSPAPSHIVLTKNPQIRGHLAPQIFRLATFLLDEAENDARGRLKRLKRFGTFEETHANLYVAHQAKKRRRGCVPSQKVAEVAGCMSKVARGPHGPKPAYGSRTGTPAPFQTPLPDVPSQKTPVFGQKPPPRSGCPFSATGV